MSVCINMYLYVMLSSVIVSAQCTTAVFQIRVAVQYACATYRTREDLTHSCMTSEIVSSSHIAQTAVYRATSSFLRILTRLSFQTRYLACQRLQTSALHVWTPQSGRCTDDAEWAKFVVWLLMTLSLPVHIRSTALWFGSLVGQTLIDMLECCVWTCSLLV